MRERGEGEREQGRRRKGDGRENKDKAGSFYLLFILYNSLK